MMRSSIRLATTALGIAALACAALPGNARGDELKLKDGSKISGTIVGFEENSFRVKTTYGFAVVQKDQVVAIIISAGGAKADPANPAAAVSEKASKPASPPVKSPSTAPKTVGSASDRAAANAPIAASASPPAAANSAAHVNAASAPNQSKNAAPAASSAASPGSVAAAAPPPKPAEPAPMREEVQGNTYTNVTYGFRMFKPPDWEVIQGARTILPGAIMAMGTDDQTTYLLIGQDTITREKSVASDMSATNQRLHEILDNFRPLGQSRITVSGASALELRFRGTADDREWSGVVVFVTRDTHLYTIFGMTLADTDLVQIQENVIGRAISSLQFIQQ
ncbi:MAG: hypothetical protein WA879_03890 [Candidatus Acidiferrales bacterium]